MTERMSEHEYRTAVGVNKSTLWEIRKSPAHYKWAIENQGEDTPAMKMGRAIHMMVLTPEDFDDNYALALLGVDRRTKEGKAAWAAFMEENQGKEILSPEEMDKVMAVSKAVMNSDAAGLIARSRTEVPLFWDDPRTGIRCKCRVDAILEEKDRVVVMDLKTTADAGANGFTRSAVKYGYHVQAAHYINGVKANGLDHGKPVEWAFIAVEKDPPYAVSILRADRLFIDEGQFKLMELMDKLDECMRVDEYPGYGEGEITMPAWAMSEGND